MSAADRRAAALDRITGASVSLHRAQSVGGYDHTNSDERSEYMAARNALDNALRLAAASLPRKPHNDDQNQAQLRRALDAL